MLTFAGGNVCCWHTRTRVPVFANVRSTEWDANRKTVYKSLFWGASAFSISYLRAVWKWLWLVGTKFQSKSQYKILSVTCNRWLLVNLSLHSICIPHLRSNSQHNDPSRRKLQKLGQWTKYNQHIDASQNKKKHFFGFWGYEMDEKVVSLQKFKWQKKVSGGETQDASRAGGN